VKTAATGGAPLNLLKPTRGSLGAGGRIAPGRAAESRRGCVTVPPVPAPGWRLVGIAAAGTAGLVLPLSSGAAPSPRLHSLRNEAASLASKKRSAILGLYSLDARVSAAYRRVDALRRTADALRAQRAVLAAELRLAKLDTRISQRRLAARLRALYDHGGTSTLEVIFGAGSLTEAMTELDNLNSVSSADEEIVVQVRSARLREAQTGRKLAIREHRLAAAIAQAGAEARGLAAVRSQRSAYLASLASRQALDAQRISALEAQAREAQVNARRLTLSAPAATVATPAPARRTQSSGNVVTVVSTGYCLMGTTATGLPVGWGVAAVDPGVIPLGTHLTIPGYGTAVAADTGGAIVGNRIDLWFPSCAQAGGWGTRSVTIALH
jgi:3D (Asp-Asp-Asp) domain-containing protein